MTDTPTPRVDAFCAEPSDAIDARELIPLWIDFARTLERDLAACRAVLRELVACKDLHDRIDALRAGVTAFTVDSLRHAENDYEHRKPLAWSAARALVGQEGDGRAG